MSAFPTHPDAVTPDWLNGVLAGSSGAVGTIKSVRWEPIGTGQVGDSVRFHCTLAGQDAPTQTLAAKFAAEDTASRGTATMLGLYSKEVRFYQELAPMLDMRVPQAYAALVSDDGSQFILLFEDMGPAHGGNQIAGCTIDHARKAIKQAAAFHAPSWGNRAVLEADWLKTSPELKQWIASQYPQAQAVFKERYSDVLEPDFMDLCDEVAASSQIFYGRQKPPQCLVHGDFRLDNMLFDIKGGAEPMAILDWQTVTAGTAMSDIGYFLGCGIGDELRRPHEIELLELYVEEMRARGVDLSVADLWHDYRVGALNGVTTAVFSAANVERTERGDANFLSMARGACALAIAHNSLAALKEDQ